MPEFVEHFEKATPSDIPLTEAAETPGSPHTIVVTPAAMRAMHVVRALRKFQSKDAMIAKFFAKHIKLAEAIETCEKVRYVAPYFSTLVLREGRWLSASSTPQGGRWKG